MENDNLLIGVSQAIRLRNRDNKTYIGRHVYILLFHGFSAPVSTRSYQPFA
jgi:hypothetical protein